MLVLAAAGRLVARDHASDETYLPALLSATGLYSDVATLTIAPGNRSYVPQYPLWTDGALKRRWVRLPDDAAIDVSDVDAWDFPVGTRFWKEFSFAGRRVETRLLVKVAADRWAFGSYRWNEDQGDAVLAPAEGVPAVADVAPGVRHSIPSREDCRACHDSNRTEILGFSALQLSDDRDTGALHAEALAPDDLRLSTLVAEGRLVPGRPELVSDPPRIPASSAEERAALGYLSTNCGVCHNRVSTLAPLGLMLRQPAYGGGLAAIGPSLTRRTKWDRPGAAAETTHVVDPADLELSALLLRMRSRRPSSQMPPLGSVLPDHDAVRLVTRFLAQARLSQARSNP